MKLVIKRCKRIWNKFSKYKKVTQKKLLNSLINGRIEQSCYWMRECMCWTFFELWDIIILF